MKNNCLGLQLELGLGLELGLELGLGKYHHVDRIEGLGGHLKS